MRCVLEVPWSFVGSLHAFHTAKQNAADHGFASLVDPEAGRPTAGDRVRLVRGVAGKGSLKTSATVGEIVQDDRDHLPYKVVGPVSAKALLLCGLPRSRSASS